MAWLICRRLDSAVSVAGQATVWLHLTLPAVAILLIIVSLFSRCGS